MAIHESEWKRRKQRMKRLCLIAVVFWSLLLNLRWMVESFEASANRYAMSVDSGESTSSLSQHNDKINCQVLRGPNIGFSHGQPLSMHLIYVDESGNSGKHLGDPQQPIFVLAALIVPEDQWAAVEQALEESVQKVFKGIIPPDKEIHTSDLRNGKGIFRGITVQNRMELRDEWLTIAANHKLPFIYRAIVKRRFATWVAQEFPAGVAIDPHVVAFPLIAQSVNEYLRQATGSPRGIFISDEKKEIIADVEKTIRLLRGDPGQLRLSQIIEKGFFVDSQKSRHLQLCDLCAYYARKREEIKEGFGSKPLDAPGIQLIEPLIHRGKESLPDVLRWFVEKNQPHEKRSGQGKIPGR